MTAATASDDASFCTGLASPQPKDEILVEGGYAEVVQGAAEDVALGRVLEQELGGWQPPGL